MSGLVAMLELLAAGRAAIREFAANEQALRDTYSNDAFAIVGAALRELHFGSYGFRETLAKVARNEAMTEEDLVSLTEFNEWEWKVIRAKGILRDCKKKPRDFSLQRAADLSAIADEKGRLRHEIKALFNEAATFDQEIDGAAASRILEAVDDFNLQVQEAEEKLRRMAG